MKAFKRNTWIISAALTISALVIGGCSSDNQITASSSKIVPANDCGINGSAKLTENNGDQAEFTGKKKGSDADELITITAKVKMIDIEGGCFYLETKAGDTYTPVIQDDLKLEIGMIIKARGYIDRNIFFYCGNGPAFVIQKYEIVELKSKENEDRAKK